MQIYDKNAPGFDSVIEPSRVAKFENAGAGGGTGAPLTPAQQAAVDSGITAEKVAEYDETSTWVESKEKTGIIPPEPDPPTPTEEIIVDITQQVLDAGWVIGKDGDVTRGCAPVKYANESYWNYDDFAFIKSSRVKLSNAPNSTELSASINLSIIFLISGSYNLKFKASPENSEIAFFKFI